MDWISTGDAADRMGISPVRVRQLIDQGRLEFQKMGRFFVVSAKSVAAFKRKTRGRKPKRRRCESQ